jgi:hypothetical protein
LTSMPIPKHGALMGQRGCYSARTLVLGAVEVHGWARVNARW